MIHFIYRWKDPRNPDSILCTKYVGITINPNERREQHLRCDGDNLEKDTWMLELDGLRLKPLFEIIEIVYDDNELVYKREKYWIQYYLKQGCELTNIKSAEIWRKERGLPTTPNYPAKKRSPRYRGTTGDF